METILTTVEDNILDALTFQLGSSSNYITERKSVSSTRQEVISIPLGALHC